MKGSFFATLAAIALFSTSSFAQPFPGTFGVTAKVKKPITMSCSQILDFGTDYVQTGLGSSDNVIINPKDSTVTKTTNVTNVVASSRAICALSGTKSKSVKIDSSATGVVTLASTGNPSITADTFLASDGTQTPSNQLSVTLDATTGAATVYFGGTLHFIANADGDYSTGTATVQMTYN